MLFIDIKTQLIEIEIEKEDEAYIQDLEYCSHIDQLIEIVADYYGVDLFEACHKILTKIS